MREIRTSGSMRGEWVVLSDIAHSPTLLVNPRLGLGDNTLYVSVSSRAKFVILNRDVFIGLA
jgi:hypothetical protein